MTDRFGREINYLRLSVTDRCNLRCRYCMPDGCDMVGHGDILSYEEFLRLARLFASLGVEHIRVTGDEMVIAERTGPRPYQAAVITLSDKGAAGEREDLSGPAIARELEGRGYEVVEKLLLPDGQLPLKAQLIRLCDQRQLDLILTTGGTGFTPRDQTPEATLAVADKTAPGIAEAIRAESMKYTKRAMFSRGEAVIRGKTLIINLPGSPKAVRESMEVFMDALPHALDMLRNTVHDCAR